MLGITYIQQRYTSYAGLLNTMLLIADTSSASPSNPLKSYPRLRIRSSPPLSLRVRSSKSAEHEKADNACRHRLGRDLGIDSASIIDRRLYLWYQRSLLVRSASYSAGAPFKRQQVRRWFGLADHDLRPKRRVSAVTPHSSMRLYSPTASSSNTRPTATPSLNSSTCAGASSPTSPSCSSVSVHRPASHRNSSSVARPSCRR